MAKPSVSEAPQPPKASALDIITAILDQHAGQEDAAKDPEYPDRWTEEMKFLNERINNLHRSLTEVCEAIEEADRILDDDNIVGGISEQDAITAGIAVMRASGLADHCWEELEFMENRLDRLDAEAYPATEDEVLD